MSELLKKLTDVDNWIFYQDETNGVGTFCGDVNIPAAAAELAAKDARIRELEAAVGFYADHRRYEGPNQSPIDGDPFQPEDMTLYIWDVHRDGGEIARKALAARAAQQPPAQG